MKKLFLLALLVLGAFSLTACTEPEEKDTEAPVITAVADMELELAQGSAAPNWATYATATDNVDSTVDVVVDSTMVDLTTPGSYDLKFNATDEAGNAATELVLTVIVADETDPVVALVANSAVTFNIGSDEPDWSTYVTATDNNDTELTVTVNDLLVDMDNLGSFFVQFKATDSAGNEGSLSVEITIVDEDVPVITLNDAVVVEFFPGDTAPVWASLVTVTDNVDSGLNVTVDTTNVDMDSVGTFNVVYTVSDNQGNAAVPLTVTFTVTNEVYTMIDFENDYVLDNTGGYGWVVIEDPSDATNHLTSRPVGEEGNGGRFEIPEIETAGLDYVLEFDMALIDSTMKPVPVIVLDAVSPYTNFSNNIFIRYKAETQMFDIISIVDGKYNFLAKELAFSMVDLQMYHFEISMMGTKLTFSIDDVQIAEVYTTASHIDGEIYIKNNKAIYVDNIEVTTYDNSYMTDTTAPVLMVNDVFEFEIYEGSDPMPWAFLVNINENTQDPFTVEVTGDDLVDMNVPGDYVITYVATDAAGNVSNTATVTIKVLELPEINLVSGAVVEYNINDTAPDWSTIVETMYADLFTLDVDATNADMTAVGAFDISYNLLDADLVPFFATPITVNITVIDPSATPEAIVADAKAELDLGDVSAVTADLTLPTSNVNGATISWASDTEAVIAADGTVVQTGQVETVTLTATITKDAVSDTKVFVVTVPAASLYTELFNDDFESYSTGVNPGDSTNWGKGLKVFDYNGNQTLNIAADGAAQKAWHFDLSTHDEVVITFDYLYDSGTTTTKAKDGFLFTSAPIDGSVKPISGNRGTFTYRPNSSDFYAADYLSTATITQMVLTADTWYTWKIVLDDTNVNVYIIDGSGTETLVLTDLTSSLGGGTIMFGLFAERLDVHFDNLLIETK